MGTPDLIRVRRRLLAALLPAVVLVVALAAAAAAAGPGSSSAKAPAGSSRPHPRRHGHHDHRPHPSVLFTIGLDGHRLRRVRTEKVRRYDRDPLWADRPDGSGL